MSCADPFEEPHGRAALCVIAEDEHPCQVFADRAARTLEVAQQAGPRADESLRRIVPASRASAFDDARRVHVGAAEQCGTLLAAALNGEPLREGGAHAVALGL